MFAALFAFATSIVLMAGSTQIELGWLSALQFVMSVYFAVVGGIQGWLVSRNG